MAAKQSLREISTDLFALGETRSQVEAILGKPTTVGPNRLVYFDQALEKPTDNSGSYYLSAYIEARFSGGKLNYLGVLKSETE